MNPRLALFDCDGTLADSQHHIVDAMHAAFAAEGVAAPPAAAIRLTIGLSLPHVVAALAPGADAAAQTRLADAYRAAYFAARTRAGSAAEPLYDGIIAALDALAAAGWCLGVATGKSRRGLERLLAAHGIRDRFVTLQTADVHPSKPHPAMVAAACAEARTRPADCVVIGDTAHDVGMAVNAGARSIGVTWGYHSAGMLRDAGADAIADAPARLPAMLAAMLAAA